MSEKQSVFGRMAMRLRDWLHPEPALPGFPKGDISAEFPVSLGQLAFAAALQRSVYQDGEAEMRAAWSGVFDSIDAREIGHTENRYALFTSAKRRRQYIVIRGTSNRSNLMDDLRFLKRRDEALGIEAHEGFLKLARAVRDDVAPRLRPGYRLHPVGHSLGAAEAELLAMMLAREGRDVARVVALAPPKPTDSGGWAAFPGLRLVQVVAPFDPVPFLPPRSLTMRDSPYAHRGALLMLLDGAHAAAVPAALYDDMKSALLGAWSSGKKFDVPDHMMGNYLARIESKRGGIGFVDAAAWMAHATPVEDGASTLDIIKGFLRPSSSPR